MTSRYEANEEFRELLTVDDPALAEQLRSLFGIAKRFGLDLATTVVPVVSVDAAPGGLAGGASVGARLAAIPALVGIIGVRNAGSEPISVSDIYAAGAIAAGARAQIRYHPISTPIVYDFGGEAYPIATRDPGSSYPGVTSVIGHTAAGQMPVDWDTDYGVPYEVQLGGNGIYSRYSGPWIVPPGYRLIIFRTLVNVELFAHFAIE